ncbi:tRNA 2-thiouridine(34) synthase MnmA [candidate division WOR-3 bacterium]|nr:tRNA 2-thiouridine(34) synthase MnmA [candidate division WOR-3 bacterium]
MRVVCAMSGGVDSSTAAAILKAKGYEVIGFTMKLFDNSSSDEAIYNAKRVASQLGIPHYAIDLRDDFEKEVIDYFINEYSKGRTPNPCVICNQKIKFGLLLQKAEKLGVSFIATGHYAKVEYASKLKRYILRKGKDRDKDQSYFLAMLSQESLSKTLFPLGDYTKDEVRKMASEMQLKVAEKPESQEVCFIPDNDYIGFICKKTSLKEGNIIDKNGKVLGKHKGIARYTIGQRRGIGNPTCPTARRGGKPFYVIGINPDKNTITVGDEVDLYSSRLIVEHPNWLSIKNIAHEMKVHVKIRHKHNPAEAILIPKSEKTVLVKFKEPQRAITPGQLTVFYKNDAVIGGGWIK